MKHVYDDIEEMDHPLPRWWLLTLYGAIVFSVGYWGWYHTFDVGDSTSEAYAAAVARHDAAAQARLAAAPPASAETLAALAQDAAAVGRGKQVYEQNCTACHGADLRGLVGPSLVDATWIHGAAPTDILRTVQDGVLAKGMPSWRPVLGPTRTAEVTAFILASRATHGG